MGMETTTGRLMVRRLEEPGANRAMHFNRAGGFCNSGEVFLFVLHALHALQGASLISARWATSHFHRFLHVLHALQSGFPHLGKVTTFLSPL